MQFGVWSSNSYDNCTLMLAVRVHLGFTGSDLRSFCKPGLKAEQKPKGKRVRFERERL